MSNTPRKFYKIERGFISSYTLIKETNKTYVATRDAGPLAGMEFRTQKRLVSTTREAAIDEAEKQINDMHEAAERAMDRINAARAALTRYKAITL